MSDKPPTEGPQWCQCFFSTIPDNEIHVELNGNDFSFLLAVNILRQLAIDCLDYTLSVGMTVEYNRDILGIFETINKFLLPLF